MAGFHKVLEWQENSVVEQLPTPIIVLYPPAPCRVCHEKAAVVMYGFCAQISRSSKPAFDIAHWVPDSTSWPPMNLWPGTYPTPLRRPKEKKHQAGRGTLSGHFGSQQQQVAEARSHAPAVSGWQVVPPRWNLQSDSAKKRERVREVVRNRRWNLI